MNISKSVLVAASFTAGCAASTDVITMTESLDPLRDHFNANKNKHRFIAVLSPT